MGAVVGWCAEARCAWAALEKEREEKEEAEASVAVFRRQLASIKEKCASLDVEIEQHRIVAANLLRGAPPFHCVPCVSFR